MESKTTKIKGKNGEHTLKELLTHLCLVLPLCRRYWQAISKKMLPENLHGLAPALTPRTTETKDQPFGYS